MVLEIFYVFQNHVSPVYKILRPGQCTFVKLLFSFKSRIDILILFCLSPEWFIFDHEFPEKLKILTNPQKLVDTF